MTFRVIIHVATYCKNRMKPWTDIFIHTYVLLVCMVHCVVLRKLAQAVNNFASDSFIVSVSLFFLVSPENVGRVVHDIFVSYSLQFIIY
jgi:hypothetical protein